MGMSTWAPLRDWSLLRWLIDVGLLSRLLLLISWEPVLLGLQVPERLSRQRILLKRLVGCVLCSTALIRLLPKWWINCLKVWPSKALGLVSMSSTESISKCCPSSPNNFWLSEWPFSETDPSNRLNSTESPFQSFLITVSSSQWTPVTQAEPNFQTTWNRFSDQSVWWSQIMPWSLKSCFSQKVSRMPAC